MLINDDGWQAVEIEVPVSRDVLEGTGLMRLNFDILLKMLSCPGTSRGRTEHQQMLGLASESELPFIVQTSRK